MEEHERIRISGVINDVTFANPENGFTVLELESGDELITAVGVMPELKAGELLELSGYWDFHASFGRQFRVELCEHKMPASAGDILRYLAAGGVKGIGSKLAVKIVDKFGENTLDIIENDPERLAQIRGISPEKAKQISADFKRQFAVREIMISLEKYGMTTAECVKAFNAFGVRAADIIKRNPYALCGEGVGFSFERAEFIADQLPDPPDNGYRLQAGVLHVMSHNLSNGHTCIPREKMFAPCAELLSTNEDTVDITIDELIGSGRLVSEFIDNREFLFLPHIYKAEKSSAERMKQILRFPPAGRKAADREIDRIEKKNGIKYGDLQRKAIVTAIERGLLILTGGPGTGKTTTLNGILQLFEDDGLKVALAAPTGRAAKRMSEVTGRPAKTIHRLLEVEWDKHDRPQFSRNARNPLDAQAVILDELSMVDITLFSSFLEALPIGCRLVMVGDSDQLPPVGAGNVLHDMIASGVIPVVELTEVFRQAMESLIVENAHRIVKGEPPKLGVGGKVVDTSMGLTPLEGVLMGTRSGDVDPAVLEYIMDNTGMDIHQMLNCLNKKSGFAGLSCSSDMRDVKAAAEKGDEQAKAALDVWTYRIQKYIGAYNVAVGGADAIVFTAGIGENDCEACEHVINGLSFMGVKIDPAKNKRGTVGIISTDDSTIKVLRIPTNEELPIARDTLEIVSKL